MNYLKNSSNPIQRGLDRSFRWISKKSSQPFFPTIEQQEGFLRAQRLAEKGAEEVAGLVREGWTEIQAASLYESWLRDHGVKVFFHKPFAWFQERTRFDGIHSYAAYQPSARVLRDGEVFILDAAPILDGYTCDIGYTACLGKNADYEAAMQFLGSLRKIIPDLFLSLKTGGEIWNRVDELIKDTGYDNIHQKYPFAVLGHRVHSAVSEGHETNILHFGWQSFWALISRGLLGQLLTSRHEGSLQGIWAIEPHIGAMNFGAKFEEILLVTEDKAFWLESEKR